MNLIILLFLVELYTIKRVIIMYMNEIKLCCQNINSVFKYELNVKRNC